MPLTARDKYVALLEQVGKAGLHAAFPNDFEYYMCALELADIQGNSIEYFVFPVMPNSLNLDNHSITNVKKTMGGITTMTNSTYIPRNITLQGTFGRKLRILLGNVDSGNFNALKFSSSNGNLTKNSKGLGTGIKKGGLQTKDIPFDPKVKTGYGATKLMQAICEKSNGLDSANNPFNLFYHNPASGESFLVEYIDMVINQTYPQGNMMWHYNLLLKTIAPLKSMSNTKGRNAALKAVTWDLLQKGVNVLAQDLKASLPADILKFL